MSHRASSRRPANRDQPTSLTHRAAHATWWSALEIAARYGVQFAVMILLARLLTPADFGLIAMLLAFTTVAALLVDSGFGTALVQKQDTSDDDESTVFLFGIGISVVASAILWLTAPLIADFYAQPVLVPLTLLLLFVLPLSALAAVPDALLTQRLDFRSRANAEIFASLCSGAVAVLLAWRGFGVWSLAWQSIVAIGVRAALLWLYSHWRPRGQFRLASFRQLFSFGSYMLMANLLNTISVRLQSLLIGRLYDSRALGRSDLIFRLEVIKRGVSIGLILACSPHGPLAIAWAVLGASVFAVAINTWCSHKLLGYGALAQMQDQAATLLLSLLAGYLAPSSGRVPFQEEPITGPRRERMMVFQQPALFPWLTTEQNIAYGLKLRANRGNGLVRDSVAAMLRLVGLDGFARHYPSDLSGGMRQRLEIARALAVNPQVLLMDEPLAALDALTRRHMQREVLRIWEETQKTIVFVTQSWPTAS